MIRKNQEGYILVYVLVVVLALSMFAVGLMSHAVKNHSIQKNAVTYTQDKYAAEGMVEQFVAELTEDALELSKEFNIKKEDVSEDLFNDNVELIESKKTEFWEFLDFELEELKNQSNDEFNIETQSLNDGSQYDYKVMLNATSGDVIVRAEVAVNIEIDTPSPELVTEEVSELNSEEIIEKSFKYLVSSISAEYLAYEITEGGTGE